MIDIAKKYRYRNGEVARVLCVDRPCAPYAPVISMAKNGITHTHQPGGTHTEGVGDHHHDLIEIKSRFERTVWLNIYRGGEIVIVASSKEWADDNAGPDRIACKKIELDFEEGEGLQ